MFFLPFSINSHFGVKETLAKLEETIKEELPRLNTGSFIVVQTKDIREHGYVLPLGKLVNEVIRFPELWLKEIIIVAPENPPLSPQSLDNLQIIHQYLLVYEVVK